MSTSQLIVVRHGETEWSHTGRHTGRTDIPLTERGEEEARDASRTVAGWSVDRAYTSPLVRARHTAQLVEPACELVVDDDLVEWDYGVYEGEATPQTRERIPGWSVWTHEIVDGESVDEVGERADRFIARFDREVGGGGTGVVFAHGHLLAILIARWCGLPAVEGRRFALATATVSLLGWHREDRVIRAINHRVGDRLDPPARA
ncbi:MAG: histidine phosphatase family protein [Ilumatobacteraceae bacterium]|nr:histidine phosphatase family protein [Ilumatobacteraceae bacterium]